jgi:undecaprenyl-diphosphatase
MMTNSLRRWARLEWPIIVAFMIPVAALWAFLELADEVAEGSTTDLDRAILLGLREPGDLADPLGPRWLEEMMRDFTALGGIGVLILITIGVSGYLLLQDKGRAAVAIVLAVGGGMLLSNLLKLGFDRPRPDLVPHASIVYTTSFPSGHSMMAAVVYLTLAAMAVRVQPALHLKIYIKAAAAFITLLVGVSRVYVGVHWPTDVLAGWSIGISWALACWGVMLLLQRHGDVEGEHDRETGR